ncbi:MAG: hypothetical protein IJ677_05205 [Alphaproteobacteria bacterium]|nr:hypothetical protein [Alphaproteobacteria bacterium]
MEKFFKLLYYYCLGGFVISVVYLTIMLFISPRQDALKRGFIPCTEKLVMDISYCQRGEISCPLRYLWQDMKCNAKVVLSGFGAWVKGEQKTPWANYLFSPVAQAEIDEEMPYKGSVLKDMDELNKMHNFFKEKQAELEAAKNRKLELDENVIIYNPEIEIPANDAEKADRKENTFDEKSDDISQEVFEDNEWEDNAQYVHEKTEPQSRVIENIKQKTTEQLNKKDMKNEK